VEENRIPIFFGDDKRLVGYYPVEEPSAWPKADHRVNLRIGWGYHYCKQTPVNGNWHHNQGNICRV